MNSNTINRFLEAQNYVYLKAITEIKKGHKESDWMWSVFPQLKRWSDHEASGLYSIEDIEEAQKYLLHPVLGKHLIEISKIVFGLKDTTAEEIFGFSDALKFHSCMTLFASVPDTHPVFEQILKKYFDEVPEYSTWNLLLKMHSDDVV